MPALGRCVSVLILVPTQERSRTRFGWVPVGGFHAVSLKGTVTVGASEENEHAVLRAFAPLTQRTQVCRVRSIFQSGVVGKQ